MDRRPTPHYCLVSYVVTWSSCHDSHMVYCFLLRRTTETYVEMDLQIVTQIYIWRLSPTCIYDLSVHLSIRKMQFVLGSSNKLTLSPSRDKLVFLHLN
jgi:hypothetical protein